MTPDEEALRRVVRALDRHGIAYMVTGSIAASYHGRPRSTHDADVVIDPTPEQLDRFVRDIAADDAACKIDLIILKDRPFSREEFDRRQRVDLDFERGVAIVTPEDAILSKLEWARRSGDSERQLRDAAGVLELNPGIDRPYIERWAVVLGVKDLWETLAGTH